MKQVTTEIATHPKTAWFTVLLVNVSEWYVDWASPVISALTSIASFIVMVLLVRYHWMNTKHLKLTIEEQIKRSSGD